MLEQAKLLDGDEAWAKRLRHLPVGFVVTKVSWAINYSTLVKLISEKRMAYIDNLNTASD